MKKRVFAFFILFYHTLHCVVSSDDNRSLITLEGKGVTLQGKLEKNDFYYDLKLDPSISKFSFIKLTCSVEEGERLSMFVSSFDREPILRSSEYKSFEPGRSIYLPKKFYANLKSFYIKVEGEESLSYQLTIRPINSIYSLSFPENFDIEIVKDKTYEFHFITQQSLKDDEIMIAVTGSRSNSNWDLSGTLLFDGKKKQLQNFFHNGIGVTISKSELESDLERKEFFLRLTSDADDLVTIELRKLRKDEVYTLYPNEVTSILLSKSSVSEILFSFYSGEKKGEKPEDNYVMLWNSYKENIAPSIRENDEIGYCVGRRYLSYSEFYYHLYSIPRRENSFFSVAVRDKFKDGSVQVQLIDKESWKVDNPVVTYLSLGVPASGAVPRNKMIYYRIKYVPKRTTLHFLFQKFNGNPALFLMNCKGPYPECFVRSYELDEFIKDKKVKEVLLGSNDFAHEQLDTGDEENREIIAFVYCGNEKDEMCFYDLSVRDESSTMYLSRNMRYNKPILMKERDFYSFRVSDPQVKEVEVILYTFMGDMSLKVEAEGEETEERNVQNKRYIRIAGEDLVKDYHVTVEGKNAGYYTIYFTSFTATKNKELQVQSGELITETINKKEETKTFRIYNRHVSQRFPFVVTFTTLNCKVSVQFQDEEKIADRAQFVITAYDDIYELNRYPFQVKFLSLDTGSTKEDDDCIFYITGNDNMHTLQINEGVIHSITLSKQLISVFYGYDIYRSGNDVISVSLTKLDNKLISLGHYLSHGYIKMLHLTSSRMIILQSEEIAKGCRGEKLCRFVIVIDAPPEIQNDRGGINFQIGISSNHLVPTYLKKGDIRLDGVFGKQGTTQLKYAEYIYYYTDIGKNSNCEVVVDFKRGSGNAVAAVYKKGEREKASLKKDSTDTIPFDYYNKKFSITDEDLRKCDDGCELVIGVYSDDESKYFSFNEFSVFIRTTGPEPTVVSLPVAEYAYGSLSKTEKEDEYHYFKTIIFKNTDRIILDFNSDLCAGYVNINSDELPNKNKYDFVIQGQEPLTEIKVSDSKIKDGTFLDKKITIAISTKTLDGKYDSFYSYRVIAPERMKKTVIDLNSGGDVICKVQEGKCYFKLEIYPYHYASEIYFYAFSEKLSNEEIEIYANAFELREYRIKDIKATLPTEESYNFTSKGTLDTDKLHLTLEETNNDIHIYIMVKTSFHTGTIKFLTTFLKPPLKTTLRPNSYQMFSIEKDSNITFSIKGNDIYYVEATRLFGGGYVKNSGEPEEIELDSENTNIATIIKPSESTFFTVKAGSRGNFVFCVKYIVRTDQGNFDEIPYNKVSHIKYLKSNFPIAYFIPLEKEIITDIVVTVHFIADEEAEARESSENFILTGAITNENYIISRKKSIDDNLVAESYGKVSFNKELHLGKYMFSRQDILDCKEGIKKYFFIQIAKEASNQKQYKNVVFDVMVSPSISSEIVPPVNQFFYTLLDTKKNTIIKMKKTEPSHIFMGVQLGVNLTNYNIKIFTEKNEEITVYQVAKLFGKNILLIEDLLEAKTIQLSITPKGTQSSNSSDSLMIKYRTSSEKEKLFEIPKNDTEVSFQFENGKFVGRVNPLRNEEGEVFENVKYVLRLFDYNRYQEENDLESLGNTDLPYKSFRGIARGSKVEFNVENFPKGEYYANVIALLEKEKDQFLYKTQYITSNVNKMNSLNKYNWYVLFLVPVIIVILGVIFILHRKIRKEKSKQKSDMIEYQKLR